MRYSFGNLIRDLIHIQLENIVSTGFLINGNSSYLIVAVIFFISLLGRVIMLMRILDHHLWLFLILLISRNLRQLHYLFLKKKVIYFNINALDFSFDEAYLYWDIGALYLHTNEGHLMININDNRIEKEYPPTTI